MARDLSGLAAALGMIGDVVDESMKGQVKGALAAPHYAAQLQDNAQRAQMFPYQLEHARLTNQTVPLHQQLLQGQIGQLNRPELIKTPYGVSKVSPTGEYLGEVPLPRPNIETGDFGMGFNVRITTPDGDVHYRRDITPERSAAAQAALSQIKPTDMAGMMRFASQYPEFGGGLEKWTETMRKWQHDHDLREHYQRMDARLASLRSQAHEPRTVETTTPGGPMKNMAEANEARSIFNDLVGYSKEVEVPGKFFGTNKEKQYQKALLEQDWPGFSDPTIPDWTIKLPNGQTDTLTREQVIRYEMRKRGYDVTPQWNTGMKQWEGTSFRRMPQIKESTTTYGPRDGGTPQFIPMPMPGSSE